MIYEIYMKYHDYTPALSLHPQKSPEPKSYKATFRSNFKQLLPYRVPHDHYDNRKVAISLHKLTKSLILKRDSNSELASRILLSHGKSQTRKFLHRAKQLFGNQLHLLKKYPSSPSESCPIRGSYDSTPGPNSNLQFVKNQSLFFNSYFPDFTIRTNRQQPTQIRIYRRKNLGIDEADLKNYQDSKRGFSTTNKRKERKKSPKDFKKLNMKGFAANIAANLQSKQKISTKTLARFMNVNIQTPEQARANARKRIV